MKSRRPQFGNMTIRIDIKGDGNAGKDLGVVEASINFNTDGGKEFIYPNVVFHPNEGQALTQQDLSELSAMMQGLDQLRHRFGIYTGHHELFIKEANGYLRVRKEDG